MTPFSYHACAADRCLMQALYGKERPRYTCSSKDLTKCCSCLPTVCFCVEAGGASQKLEDNPSPFASQESSSFSQDTAMEEDIGMDVAGNYIED